MNETPVSVPRQVRLKTCALYSPTVTEFDLRPLIGAIDIYESIFDNTISAKIQFREASGYGELLTIVGMEYIVLEFEIDYVGDGKRPNGSIQTFRRVFRVRKLGEQIFPRNETREYSLDLVTQEFINSLSIRILHRFDGTIEETIKTLMKQYLKIEDKNIATIEPCSGLMTAVIPNYTPLQAINFYSTLALTRDAPQENSFLFFETLAGFHFVSLRTLMTQPSVASYEVEANRISGVGAIDEVSAYNSIIKLNQDQTFDLAHDIVTGMLRSKMLHLDFFSRKWKEEDSRYTETFKQTTHLDKYPVYPDNLDLSVGRNVKIFVVPTNISTASESPYFQDEYMNPMNIQKAVVLRNRQFKEISHLRTKLQVPGQPDIRAGATIDLIYPSARALQGGTQDGDPTKTPAKSPTPYHSGKHLVTSVHHSLIHSEAFSMEYRMDIEAVRDSFRSPLPSTINFTEPDKD